MISLKVFDFYIDYFKVYTYNNTSLVNKIKNNINNILKLKLRNYHDNIKYTYYAVMLYAFYFSPPELSIFKFFLQSFCLWD